MKGFVRFETVQTDGYFTTSFPQSIARIESEFMWLRPVIRVYRIKAFIVKGSY